MLSVFMGIQWLGILILGVEICYIFRQRSSRLQVLLLCINIATLVNFVGYLMELQATTMELALQAVKFIYLGKPFIILGMFFFMLELYQIKCPRALTVLLCGIHIGVSLLVLTCEKQSLFYSSIEFVEEGYFPHLVLGHGIVYNLFTVCIVVYLALILIFGAIKYRRSGNLRERKKILYMNMIAVVSAASLLLFLSGVTGGYDTTLPAYVISTLCLLICMVRYDLLDTLALAKDNVIDEFADGLVVLDSGGQLIYANPQVQRIYPALSTGDCGNVLQELEAAGSTGEKLFREEHVYEVEGKDIMRRDFRYGRMYVVRDTTENYNHMLDLKRQTEIAEQANRAKSDFLAKMSHEIRTPINAVLGMNEMVLRESAQEEIRAYAMDIKSSANALLSIINDILDSSKIESGKLQILPVEYQLDSLLNDVFHMMYVKAAEKDLRLDILVDEKLPNGLFGDDVRIRQIMVNLLNNAVKYTPEGTVTLAVSGTVRDKEAVLHIEVRDTGIGIKEEDLPKLYAAFERIEESRNRGIEGTGLGMSIVIELLNLMGSRLEVASVYGEGSVFSFDLRQPIVQPEPIGDFQERVRQYQSPSEYQAAFTAPEASVLVVDDNEMNRKVFRALLKETRIRVTSVESGQRCLECVAQEHYDIIFLDHMMPDMDGVETLHRMKQQEENLCRDVPVVILTANAVTGAREYYLEQGFDEFLSKPIVPEKMEHMIRMLLPEKYILPGAGDVSLPSEEEQLPELEEFDWDYARMHIPNDGTLREMLEDMYHNMSRDRAELAELADQIEEERLAEQIGEERSEGQSGEEDMSGTALDRYRIQVHALKSTTAMVGALLLSRLARMLEVAAKQRDLERIQLLNPILLEELEKHRERLAVLFPEKELKEFTPEDAPQIRSLLYMLKGALQERDYDSADYLAEQLGQYRFRGAMEEDMERLKEQILNLEAQQALAVTEAMLGSIEEELKQ